MATFVVTVGARLNVKPTERFGAKAVDYAAARPSYPAACFSAIFAGFCSPSDLTVVDLGAGTGISTRLLAAYGAKVIAVEPSPAMREQAAPAEGVRWQPGTAEHTRLPAASADLVTAFQAFHWFDAAAALRETRRILRPGGRAAAIYNERNEADAFTAAYGALVRRFATDDTEARRSAARAAFRTHAGWTRVEERQVANVHVLDRAGLHARTRSSSYLPNEDAAGKALHDALDALIDSYPDDRELTLVMKTIVIVGYTST